MTKSSYIKIKYFLYIQEQEWDKLRNLLNNHSDDQQGKDKTYENQHLQLIDSE